MKDSDFQPRVDVGFEIPLAEDFSFTINNEVRFRDNSKRIDRNYLQGSFSWETCDYFSLDAGYIFQSILNIGDLEYKREWQYRHRVFLDLKAELELDDWKLSLTERPLVNLRPWADGIHDPKAEWLIRDYGGGPFVDRLRFCLGMKWDFSDFCNMELYYYFDIKNARDVSYTHNDQEDLYRIYLNKERQYVHVLGLSFNFGWN